MRWLMLAAVLLAGCTTPSVPPGGAKGVIRFTGAVPPGKVLTMDAEEACQKLHAQPPEEKLIITGAEGALANAFVYIKAGLPAGTKYPAPTQTVVLEQKGCQFVPRVLAVRAGQVLTVKNADPVSHNIHPMPKNNYDWNQQQPPGAEDLRRKFAREEVMIPVKCNVHAWMRSYIAVMEHPFHAVTGSDGSFAFNGLPPGAYVLGVWHETLGEREAKLLVKSGETAEAAIAYQ